MNKNSVCFFRIKIPLFFNEFLYSSFFWVFPNFWLGLIEDGDLSVEKLVELLLFTLQLIEGIRQTAVTTEEPEIDRLEAIVKMIDNFEMMGETEHGKFDLNSIFQRLMDQRERNLRDGDIERIPEENEEEGGQGSTDQQDQNQQVSQKRFLARRFESFWC